MSRKSSATIKKPRKSSETKSKAKEAPAKKAISKKKKSVEIKTESPVAQVQEKKKRVVRKIEDYNEYHQNLQAELLNK